MGNLAQVYRRGRGAYLGRRFRKFDGGLVYGQVNSYMSGKGGARKADADIYKRQGLEKNDGQ